VKLSYDGNKVPLKVMTLFERTALVIVGEVDYICEYLHSYGSEFTQSYFKVPTTILSVSVVKIASRPVRQVKVPYPVTIASEQRFLFSAAENRLTVPVFTPMPGALIVSNVPPKLPSELG
jgi:hypothetical protein